MSTELEDKKVMLKMLYKASPKLRKAILADLPSDVVRLLSECALNVLKGPVVLTPRHKKKLHRHRKNLRDLAKGNTAVKKKKEIIQTGGFLPALLTGVIASLLPQIIARKRQT